MLSFLRQLLSASSTLNHRYTVIMMMVMNVESADTAAEYDSGSISSSTADSCRSHTLSS